MTFVRQDMELDELLNYVHIDEKWFYLTQTSRTYYLVPGESEPERKCKSKRFLTKVMFHTAVARPRFNDDGGTWWTGKIGTRPFVETVLAQRTSSNRHAGTPETKPLVVTKDVYRSFLINKVLPAVVKVWPQSNVPIIIQHDNARAHVTTSDIQLRTEFDRYSTLGGTFQLASQPPNSPDTNILDLGFFAALQSLQHRKSALSIDELVMHVLEAFDEYPYDRLDRTFLTLQCCLIETLKVGGNNSYKVPHMSKVKLARQGSLPRNVECPRDVYNSTRALLSAVDVVALDRELENEAEDALVLCELSSQLESIALIGEDDVDDIIGALHDIGMEPICMEE